MKLQLCLLLLTAVVLGAWMEVSSAAVLPATDTPTPLGAANGGYGYQKPYYRPQYRPYQYRPQYGYGGQ
nr:unnamed protein product [Spirometra erinaceieuropaei]VZI25183.1 unnamed protein product [Spirometra erinaceieuropaei]